MTVEPERLHALVSHCADFARRMLIERGEFFPFAAVIDADDLIEPRGAWDGSERPDPKAIYELLAGALHADAATGAIRAAALVANVDIPAAYLPQWPDGLRIKLETDGYSRFIYIPYQLSGAGPREAEFATPFAVEAEPEIFEAAA